MSLLRRTNAYSGVIFILVILALPVVVGAQAAPPVRPPLNLMTSPLPLNVTTKPGQPVTADIRLKNNGTQQELLKVELLKFGAAGDTGRPQLLERAPQDQFFDWVAFSETVFTADPNVWKTIHMTISPPKEAAFGYYYAVLFTRANPDRPSGGSSALQGGVASLVLLTVDTPGARRQVEVTSIAAGRRVYEFLPAKLSIKLHNSGNLHVVPGGTLFIKRGSAQVAALDFNADRGNILPGTDRVFDMTWSDGFPAYSEVQDSTGATKHKLVWDLSKVQKLRFGRYTAQLVAVYDGGERDVPIEATVSFWVIPWRVVGAIFLVLLLVFAGIWGVSRLLWLGFRKRVIAMPSTLGGTTTVPQEQESESSLAAALKRRKPKKEETPEEPLISEADAAKEVPVAPRRGRPPKKKTVSGPVPAVDEVATKSQPATPKAGRPKATKKTGAKLLATKPVPKKKRP